MNLIKKICFNTLLCTAVMIGFPELSVGQISTDSLDGRVNVINTAVPFLRIVPDARAGAMGDAGIAVTPDANSIQWNVAKLAFVEKDISLSTTYTPWLRELVNDIYLAYLAGYVRIDENQTFGSSLRYFSLGNIIFTDIVGNETGEFRPHEFTFDLGYARKFAKNLSTGLTMRFIYSNLAAGQDVSGVTIHPGVAVAADIAMYYRNDIEISEKDALFALGVNIANIGSKITYTKSKDKDFIPTNLGLGTALKISFDDYNDMQFAFDINKLLVPTPPDPTDVVAYDEYKSMGVVEGIFTSFGDAPNGFKEEMQELMFSLGIEYWYNNQFAIRTGFFNEHKLKGNRKFFTVGVGLKYNVFGLNFSYLVPTTSQRNPLDNTLRFSLLFDFGAFGADKEEQN